MDGPGARGDQAGSPGAGEAMKVIWKYPLVPWPPTLAEREGAAICYTIGMPRGARLLTAASQYEAPCVWAAVDPAGPMTSTRVFLVGTGLEIPERAGRALGTMLFSGGNLVLHAFAEREGNEV